MTVRRSAAEVLSAVPGWEGSAATRLEGGLTNRTWLIERDGRRAVLKIDDEPRRAPFNSRADEAGIQSVAAAAGLANPVLHVGSQVYITAWVDGTVLERRSLEQTAILERVAAALRRMHSLPLCGRSFDSTIAAKRYVEKISNPDRRLVALATGVIEKMRLPHNLCCCHNDLVADNIIAMPDIRFLDWEYACDNDPMFDLATLVEHHQLGEDTATQLLDAYFDGDGARWRDKLRDQQRLYLALLWLWMASRPGTSQDEISGVADRLQAAAA